MRRWSGVSTCTETSLVCFRKLGWVIKVSGSQQVPPITDVSFNLVHETYRGLNSKFCTTSAFNLYIPIYRPDETSTYIRCNYTWTRCSYTSTVTSLTLCDGSGCDWIAGRHLQRRPVPSSQITQAICPKRFWDEIWARHHAIHFLSIASEDISLHCIGSK